MEDQPNKSCPLKLCILDAKQTVLGVALFTTLAAFGGLVLSSPPSRPKPLNSQSLTLESTRPNSLVVDGKSRPIAVASVEADDLEIQHAVAEQPKHNSIKTVGSEESASEKLDSVPEIATVEKTETVDEQDRIYHEKAIGVWQDFFKGKRTLTVRKDGTATMLVELSGLTAKLFASKLTFEMDWSIKDGRMKKVSTGGKPKAKVNIVLKTVGTTVDEKILVLNNETMVLLDKDGKTKYNWKRLKPDSALHQANENEQN